MTAEPDLTCDCGREPTIEIDMASGPGCLCHIRCDCGAAGNMTWGVDLPWADLIADWHDPTEQTLRRAMVDGLVTRNERGEYKMTAAGIQLAQAGLTAH